jgi:transposase-like protein
MGKLPRRVYPREFRRQAVEMVTREGPSLAEAAHRLSLSPKTLTNWGRRARGGEPPAASAPRRTAEMSGTETATKPARVNTQAK